AAAVLGAFLVVGWPDTDTFPVRLVVASAIQLAVVAALSVDMLGRGASRA
ncbi:MAG: hypothetical protein H7Y15_03840, partial [Pseudonocardia sp.]|nr:hypothetical protein [Pseudonocardia sp.]